MDEQSQSNAGNLDLIGGAVAVDFANTVDWHDAPAPDEWLRTYQDLVDWSLHAGAVAPDEADLLSSQAQHDPRGAEIALEQAVLLRESLFRIFSASAIGEQPASADLDRLNEFLSTALSARKLDYSDGSFLWRTNDTQLDLQLMLPRIAMSAAEVLTNEHDRIRKCCGDPCGWLFLDRSRNRSRRWCDMQSCGNRAKARRFYARHKPGHDEATPLPR